MRQLWLALLLSSSLFSASLYTLDNVHSLNLYFSNQTKLLNKDQENMMKNMITEKLKKGGFVFGQTDAHIFVIQIEAIDGSANQAVHVEVCLGEEVITKRKDNIETFAYTYLSSKFIKVNDPYKEVEATLMFLVDEFIKVHKEDNE